MKNAARPGGRAASSGVPRAGFSRSGRQLHQQLVEALHVGGRVLEAVAGGQRTVLRITRSGRAALNAWLTLPVPHLRDLRSELLLKLEIGQQVGVQQASMLKEQRRIVDGIIRGLEKTIDNDDIVTAWRIESAEAARRFLDRLG